MNYDNFASSYDLAMGDRRDVALLLRKLIRSNYRKAKTLLELGCGSGSLLKVLSQHYVVEGIDLSSEMVRVARHKVPGVPLHVGNIATLRLDKTFDVVLCAFDTINHIPKFSDWQKTFDRASSHLNPDGVFIFDINTTRKLQRYVDEPPFAEFRKGATATFEVVRTAPSRFTIHVKVFRKAKDDLYKLEEMKVKEATYPVPRILNALSKHFGSVKVIDFDHDHPNVESEELYFVCSKPKTARR